MTIRLLMVIVACPYIKVGLPHVGLCNMLALVWASSVDLRSLVVSWRHARVAHNTLLLMLLLMVLWLVVLLMLLLLMRLLVLLWLMLLLLSLVLVLAMVVVALVLTVQLFGRPHGGKGKIGKSTANLCHDSPAASGVAHATIALTMRGARLR